MVNTAIEQTLAIVRQLKNAGYHWLSNSGKGDKEIFGVFQRVEKSARGLTIIVRGVAGKMMRISWRVSQNVAVNVLDAF